MSVEKQTKSLEEPKHDLTMSEMNGEFNLAIVVLLHFIHGLMTWTHKSTLKRKQDAIDALFWNLFEFWFHWGRWSGDFFFLFNVSFDLQHNGGVTDSFMVIIFPNRMVRFRIPFAHIDAIRLFYFWNGGIQWQIQSHCVFFLWTSNFHSVDDKSWCGHHFHHCFRLSANANHWHDCPEQQEEAEHFLRWGHLQLLVGIHCRLHLMHPMILFWMATSKNNVLATPSLQEDF